MRAWHQIRMVENVLLFDFNFLGELVLWIFEVLGEK